MIRGNAREIGGGGKIDCFAAESQGRVGISVDNFVLGIASYRFGYIVERVGVFLRKEIP